MLTTLKEEEAIASSTKSALARGEDILQIYRLDKDRKEHCLMLLSVLNPPKNAIVADMGSGVGTVTQHMGKERPDLNFILINNSPYQHHITKGGNNIRKLLADFQQTNLFPKSVDCVMFNYSIGYGTLKHSIQESARILKHGGILFIWDLIGECQQMQDELGYNTYEYNEFLNLATHNGFKATKALSPETSTNKHFDNVAGIYAEKFRKEMTVKPYLMRFELDKRA